MRTTFNTMTLIITESMDTIHMVCFKMRSQVMTYGSDGVGVLSVREMDKQWKGSDILERCGLSVFREDLLFDL